MQISMDPVGYVFLETKSAPDISIKEQPARIEILPQYRDALQRIAEHSHIWVIAWFHLARRDVLATVPMRINEALPVYGVFGMRSPNRPNPVGLTLVRLVRVEGLNLYVEGLDAFDGTPIVDIKPYFENDIVFSATTPNIKHAEPEARMEVLLRRAVAHHGELCPELMTGVRMAYIIQERLGHLSSPELTLEVSGSACLADTLQGLTRSRVANPPRFSFVPGPDMRPQVVWRWGDLSIKAAIIRMVPDREAFDHMKDGEIFEVWEDRP